MSTEATSRYYIIERHGINDIALWVGDLPRSLFEPYETEGHSIRGSMVSIMMALANDPELNGITDEHKLSIFYEHYESCWDYLHDIFDRGLMLSKFIREKQPSYSYLFWEDKPKHISQLPFELRAEYTQYLKDALGKHWGMSTDPNYTDLQAAIEAYETIEEEEMK